MEASGNMTNAANGQRQPSSPADIQAALSGGVPLGRWQEGLTFKGINPTPGLASAANWFPRTEEVGPEELRITFMGTAPFIRPGQMNTSIFIELGNGDNFVFDIGEGSVANYIAAGLALNQLDKIFITHLHVDHFGALPWLYMFGGWAGRWHKPLRVFGPSGRSRLSALRTRLQSHAGRRGCRATLGDGLRRCQASKPAPGGFPAVLALPGRRRVRA